MVASKNDTVTLKYEDQFFNQWLISKENKYFMYLSAFAPFTKIKIVYLFIILRFLKNTKIAYLFCFILIHGLRII